MALNENETQTKGVNNFASMMGNWLPNGYSAAGVYRCCNAVLYESIPASDVRKNWFLDGKGDAPATLPAAYKDMVVNYENYRIEKMFPYTQVKFGAYQNTPGGNIGANDYPLMRIEEMYLILAEAQGMQNVSAGVQTLNTFVNTYRDATYQCSAADATAFRKEIHQQRRIEFWGEGLSYFDILRFQTGIDRRGGGFDPAWVFVVGPDDLALIYIIPQSEQQSNAQIGAISSEATVPKPVTDVVE